MKFTELLVEASKNWNVVDATRFYNDENWIKNKKVQLQFNFETCQIHKFSTVN